MTEPLSSKPEKKTAIFLQCSLPSCERLATGFKAATRALGWEGRTLVFSTDPASAMAQAVAEKPDYIAVTGVSPSLIAPQLKAAAAANIPVMSCADTTQPAPDGFTASCGTSLAPDAEQVAHYVVNESGGKANVVTVNIPSYSQISTQVAWYKENFANLCDGCSVDTLNVTVDDLGSGQIPQKIIAYLQTHPDVNFVHFTFSDLVQGVPEALKSASLGDKVKLVGVANDKNVVQGIADGKIVAWSMQPDFMTMWMLVDAMARLSVGDELGPQYQELLNNPPFYVLEDSAAAEEVLANGGLWAGPTGYEDDFKKLWLVS